MNKFISVASGAALTTLFVFGYNAPAYAPVDMFIIIEDIDGESAKGGHKDEIDVLSWSWGETSSTRSTGERVMRPEMGAGVLTVTVSAAGKSTPLLINNCEKGKPLASVLVVQGAETYTLSEVNLRCGSSSSTAGDTPTEEVAFYYNKITFSETKTKPARLKSKKRSDKSDRK